MKYCPDCGTRLPSTPIAFCPECGSNLNKYRVSNDHSLEESYIGDPKYDPIIDTFLNSKHDLVKVEVQGIRADYLRSELDKRIQKRSLREKIEVSVVNECCYMEKKRGRKKLLL